MYNRDFSNAESLLSDPEPNSVAKMVSALQKSVEEVISSFKVQRVCSSGSMCKSSRSSYMLTCSHTHMLMHSHMHSHAHTLTCSHIHMHTCTHAHIFTCSCTHAHMHTCSHIHMHTCTHAQIHTHMHTYCTPQHVMITIALCF